MDDFEDRRSAAAQAQPPRSSTVMETLQLFSHDIRSAMSDVVGGLRLIDLDALDPETRTQVDRVQAAGDTLAELVDAALMAAAGDTLIKAEDAEVELARWIRSVSDRWTGRAQERACAFSVIAADPLPFGLLLPQVTLDRIAGNLIGNALLHAKGTPVTLEVAANRGEGLTLTVRDEGPGYPETVLKQLGETGAGAPMGDRAGAGLGLRIVAELTRQAGGRLRLANGENAGGRAELWLPDHVLAWDMQLDTPCAAPDLGGLRVLVAEDNLTNQTIIRQLLDRMQARPVFVADGVAALDTIDRDAFDIALVDIEMPRLSGLEVMRRVRARGDAKSAMPMVALTAYVLRDNREAIYDAGADGIIGKPVSSGREFGLALLRHAGRATGLPEPETILQGGASDQGLGRKLDRDRFDALLEVAGADGRSELLERLSEDLSAARAALDTAVAAADAPEIRAQTHILIAISGAVGAERLHRLAEVLNVAAKRNRLDDLAGLYAPMRGDLTDLIEVVDALNATEG